MSMAIERFPMIEAERQLREQLASGPDGLMERLLKVYDAGDDLAKSAFVIALLARVAVPATIQYLAAPSITTPS